MTSPSPGVYGPSTIAGGGGGGGAPSGPAGGDLSGSYPNPAVAKVNGVAVSGVPNSGDLIQATGPSTAVWGPGGGGPPTGAAGGDLSGTYPSPVVRAINGAILAGLASGLMFNTTGTGVPSIAVASQIPLAAIGAVGPMPAATALNAITAPTGDVTFNGHKATNLANGSASSDAAAFGQIPTALPPNGAAGGDLTGTYPNPTLGTTAVTPGAYTNANVTVDGKGRITTAASGSTSPTGAAGGDLTGTYPNPTLGTTAVTPGSYTSANITVDAKGRVTAAANGSGGGGGAGGAVNYLTGLYYTAQVTEGQPGAQPYGAGFPAGIAFRAQDSKTAIQMAMVVTALGGGNGRCAIYANTGTGLAVGSLLADSGSFSIAAIGLAPSGAISQALVQGTIYWLWYQVSATTTLQSMDANALGFMGASGAGRSLMRAFVGMAFGAFPATLSGISYNQPDNSSNATPSILMGF